MGNARIVKPPVLGHGVILETASVVLDVHEIERE